MKNRKFGLSGHKHTVNFLVRGAALGLILALLITNVSSTVFAGSEDSSVNQAEVDNKVSEGSDVDSNSDSEEAVQPDETDNKSDVGDTTDSNDASGEITDGSGDATEDKSADENVENTDSSDADTSDEAMADDSRSKETASESEGGNSEATDNESSDDSDKGSNDTSKDETVQNVDETDKGDAASSEEDKADSHSGESKSEGEKKDKSTDKKNKEASSVSSEMIVGGSIKKIDLPLRGASGDDVASVTIGGTTTYYTTIAAAFSAANVASSDCEIKLLKDCANTGTLQASNTVATVTLNLDNHTLNLTHNGVSRGNAYAAIYITGKFNLTGNADVGGGVLNLNGYEWGVYATGSNAYFTMQDGVSIHLNNSGYTAETRGICIYNSSKAQIYGGKVYTGDVIKLSILVTNSKVDIYGGYYQWKPSDESWGGATDSYQNGVISVYGGYFDGMLWCGNNTAELVKKNYKFYGGYYTKNFINTGGGHISWGDCIDSGVSAITLNPPVVYEGVSYSSRIKAVECSATSADSGMGKATVDKESLRIGDVVTFTATPKAGYQFDKWVDASGSQKSTDAIYKYTIKDTDNANGVHLTAQFSLAAPTGLALSAITNESITATWDSPIQAYYLDVATDSGFTSFVSGYQNKLITPAAGASTTSQIVSGLNSGTTYYFRVCARMGESGQGPYSTVRNAMTLNKVSFNFNGHGGTNFDVTAAKNSNLKTAVGANWNTVTSPSESGWIFGGWYTDAALTASVTLTDATTIAVDATYYAKWHKHSWAYSKVAVPSGDKLCVYCDESFNPCEYHGTVASHDGAMELFMDAVNVTYDGNAYAMDGITLEGTDELNSLTGQNISKNDIVFYTNAACTVMTSNSADGAATDGAAPVNADTYYAKLAIIENSREVSNLIVAFTIAKADCSFTAPSARTLIYTGSEQALINPGDTVDGTMLYSLREDTGFESEIPTASRRDDYTVYYKIEGDKNHNDTPVDSITVSIGKTARDFIDISMEGYTYDQTEPVPTPMINPASEDMEEAPKARYYYSEIDSNSGGIEWTDAVTAKTINAGSYYMYAVIEATDSYQEYTTLTVPFEIAMAASYPVTAPKGKLTYGETLAQAELTGASAPIEGNWTWDEGVDAFMPEVADSDVTEYDMIFTPTGEAALNYMPVNLRVKVTVIPRKVDPVITVRIDESGKVTEIITNDGTVLEEGKDYEKVVVSRDTARGTEYKVDYTFKGNYEGTASKKFSVPKDCKPGDNIISNIDLNPEVEKEYNPEVEPVSYEDAKEAINKDIEEIAKSSSDEQKEKAQAIVEKIVAGREDEIKYDIEMNVEIEALDKSSVEAERPEDVQKIEAVVADIPNASSDIRYIDISVFLTYSAKIGDDDSTKVVQNRKQVHEMKEGETITIEVPSNLRIVPKGYTRNYYVIRAHKNAEGVICIDRIAESDLTRITFKSNKFSTYALAYSDKKIPIEKPKKKKGTFGGVKIFENIKLILDKKDDPSHNEGSVQNQDKTVPVANAAGPAITVNKLKGYESPKTGDTVEVYVFTALLLVGVGILVCKRKRNTH